MNENDIEDLKNLQLQIEVTSDITNVNLDVFQKLEIALEDLKLVLSQHSKTARFWLQYKDYVHIIRTFIRASRTGDWHLYFVVLEKMLNLFAATGHRNYATSARLYIQIMKQLPESHPWLYKKLAAQRYFMIRRSKRFWAGLWPDLVIEQELMRSLKSRGGLTRGKGFTSNVRMLWVCMMHFCSSVHNSMTSLTNHFHATSDQHQELGESRIARDYIGLNKIIDFFTAHNPFDLKRKTAIFINRFSCYQ